MEIRDNFLGREDFKALQEELMGPYFPWYYNPYIAFENDESDESYQLVHVFYTNFEVTSDFYYLLDPIWEAINPKQILRAKINLGPRKSETKQYEGGWHTDFTDVPEEVTNLTTAVFYINTNNGHTLFEGGTKVESVENRFASFPTLTPHTSVSQTDSKVRIVLNLNYISH